MIEDYINEICELLDIPVPEVSYDTSHFTSDTMMAQFDPDQNRIHIRQVDPPDPDHLFAIAHELRHFWQFLTDKGLYYTDYRPRDLCGSIEEYNLQLAEIDANAFAGIVMVDFFHLKPQYQGLSDIVKSRIDQRIDYICRTFS